MREFILPFFGTQNLTQPWLCNFATTTIEDNLVQLRLNWNAIEPSRLMLLKVKHYLQQICRFLRTNRHYLEKDVSSEEFFTIHRYPYKSVVQDLSHAEQLPSLLNIHAQGKLLLETISLYPTEDKVVFGYRLLSSTQMVLLVTNFAGKLIAIKMPN